MATMNPEEEYLRVETVTYMEFTGMELVVDAIDEFRPLFIAEYLNHIGVDPSEANVEIFLELVSKAESLGGTISGDSIERRRLGSVYLETFKQTGGNLKEFSTMGSSGLQYDSSASADTSDSVVQGVHASAVIQYARKLQNTNKAGELVTELVTVGHFKQTAITKNDLISAHGTERSQMMKNVLEMVAELPSMMAKGFVFNAQSSDFAVTFGDVLIELMPYDLTQRTKTRPAFDDEASETRTTTAAASIILIGLIAIITFLVGLGCCARHWRHFTRKRNQGNVSISVGRNTVSAKWAENQTETQDKGHIIWDMPVSGLQGVINLAPQPEEPANPPEEEQDVIKETSLDKEAEEISAPSLHFGGFSNAQLGQAFTTYLKDEGEELHQFLPNGAHVQYYSQQHRRWLPGDLTVDVIPGKTLSQPEINHTVSLKIGKKVQTRERVPLTNLRMPIEQGELVEVYSNSVAWIPAVVTNMKKSMIELYYDLEVADPKSGKTEVLNKVPSARVRRRFPEGAAVSAYRTHLKQWCSGVVVADSPDAMGAEVCEPSPSTETAISLATSNDPGAQDSNATSKVVVDFGDGDQLYVSTHMLVNRLDANKMRPLTVVVRRAIDEDPSI